MLIFLLLAAAALFFFRKEPSLPDVTGDPEPDSLGGLIAQLTDFLPTQGSGFLIEQEQELGDLGEDYVFRKDFCFYFYRLSPAERAVYRQVYANTLSFREEFSMVEPLSPEELTLTMESLRYDHPELFWLSNSYRYGYNANGAAVSLILSFHCTAAEYPALQQQFDKAAGEILLAANQLPTAIEQERFVHDYLVNNCEYVDDPNQGQTAYSALVTKKSVCAGYSGAFQYLMNELGIPCYYCPGTASGGSHAWNIVMLGGNAYNVDLTWDDPIQSEESDSRRYYNYFNLTDRQIGVTHLRDEIAKQLPACQSEVFSFPTVYSPDPADPSLSYYRTADSLGLGEEIITQLSSFYPLCKEKLIASSDLSGSILLAISDEETLRAVTESIGGEDFANLCFYEVIKARKLYGYGFSMNLFSEKMPDGNYLLVFSYAFEEG